MKNRKKIQNLFNQYLTIKKNEFLLEGGFRPDSILIFNKKSILKQSNNHNSVLSKKFIDKYSPDNVDINYFWKCATDAFKYYPIISSDKISSIKDLNKISIKFHKKYLNVLDDYFEKNKIDHVMLEIGPGYGSVKEYIENKYGLLGYYAIDVNPLFKYEKLYQCDGRTIPEQIPNKVDVVYSVNVFQHLSIAQRDSYYKEIRNRLYLGGVFIFSMFAYTDETKEIEYKTGEGESDYKKLFGVRDNKGNVYTSFFNQFTKVEKVEDVIHKLEKLGFTVVTKQDAANHWGFFCQLNINES